MLSCGGAIQSVEFDDNENLVRVGVRGSGEMRVFASEKPMSCKIDGVGVEFSYEDKMVTVQVPWPNSSRSSLARRLLLDLAIHEEFTRLKNLVEEKEKELKEKQDTISALSFTPQSKTGKMLMALQEENEEIGNLASEGKMHELAMQLALQKSQNAELRSQFEGLHKHMEGLTNDVERSNEMALILQEKLEEKRSRD
ncbi:fkbp12-interacting protein of 37 kda [Quercus suber]|uniref:Fkbp12-interacting protein of 37 kDa n=1 Tax=Quercus suber TaxID=58331 RepID=A0AAW0KIH3_QUESU|nr:fkbp12-interacting protein of 37 kda [Quercus suber]